MHSIVQSCLEVSHLLPLIIKHFCHYLTSQYIKMTKCYCIRKEFNLILVLQIVGLHSVTYFKLYYLSTPTVSDITDSSVVLWQKVQRLKKCEYTCSDLLSGIQVPWFHLELSPMSPPKTELEVQVYRVPWHQQGII